MADPAGTTTPTAQSELSDSVLDVQDLRTYFFLEHGVVRAVDGVSFSLRRNSSLGIVGESGCGKSITSFSIMRLIKSPPGKIVAGKIEYHAGGNGKALYDVDITSLKAQGSSMRSIRGGEIAMIFQEPMNSLNPLYKIGYQIVENVRAHMKLNRKAAWNRALDMLKQVSIPDPEQRLQEYPHQLSGGMRQRVMIAMALSCNPQVLIADEPTTALDVTVQAQILDLLKDLQREFGSSIILITHNLGVVSQMVDEVAVMYLGKIVEHSDVRSVFQRPLHPYTQGLLKSVPVFGRKGKNVLVPIKGMVPSPADKPQGCPFATRCPHVMERCKNEEPKLEEVEPGHKVACFLYSS